MTVKKNQFPLSPSRKAVNHTAVINYQAGTKPSACRAKTNKWVISSSRKFKTSALSLSKGKKSLPQVVSSWTSVESCPASKI